MYTHTFLSGSESVFVRCGQDAWSRPPTGMVEITGLQPTPPDNNGDKKEIVCGPIVSDSL